MALRQRTRHARGHARSGTFRACERTWVCGQRASVARGEGEGEGELAGAPVRFPIAESALSPFLMAGSRCEPSCRFVGCEPLDAERLAVRRRATGEPDAP